MAGIAGAFGKAAKTETVKKMLDTIKHRGPDSRMFYLGGLRPPAEPRGDAGESSSAEEMQLAAGVVASDLGETRGNGFARKGSIVVFFDGDIYNKRSNGKTDAEIALDLYEQHGRIFPAYLEGVFACAVSDGSDVLLARDAIGVRPLYWGKTEEDDLCFASEMKALVDIAVDVRELRPATTYSSDVGIAEYIPRYPEIVMPVYPQGAANQLQLCLFRAVERRLEDGAVGGMLLSGGLDSSIIAAIANELMPGIPAFTVGVKGSPDLENAVIMAQHLGVEHYIYNFGVEEIIELVPKAVRSLESFDEDCISGALANLFASSLASKHTNCILSGEGGDELYGGYHLLKGIPTEDERLKMMGHLIHIAYNTALQRLDRAMMANSINYRTPFIDTEVIAFSLQVPVQWKIHNLGGGRPLEPRGECGGVLPRNGDGRFIEKWLLREAFKNMLPNEIYKREKLRFSGGTGVDDLMGKVAADRLTDGKFSEESCYAATGYQINTPKELWYYKIFKENFPPLAFEKLVGRWDPSK